MFDCSMVDARDANDSGSLIEFGVFVLVSCCCALLCLFVVEHVV